MHQDTYDVRHYYPAGLRHRKATMDDLVLNAELSYDGISDGYYWHGLVTDACISMRGRRTEYTATSPSVPSLEVDVTLYNDETGEQHRVPLRYLTVPCWGERG